jgi:hypothetical protein
MHAKEKTHRFRVQIQAQPASDHNQLVFQLQRVLPPPTNGPFPMGALQPLLLMLNPHWRKFLVQLLKLFYAQTRYALKHSWLFDEIFIADHTRPSVLPISN